VKPPTYADFKPVTPVRSFEEIVSQVQEAIINGKLKQGQRLASERDLCQTFGVSRATLREALRVLEALGWIEIRLGAAGGVYANRPTTGQASSALEALLRFHEATPRDLEEFRTSFEPETAAWAAKRAQAEDIEGLRDLVQQIAAAAAQPSTPWQVISELDLVFHRRIAEISRNRVRIAVMLAVHKAVQQASLSLDPLMTGAIRSSIAQELAAITEAIASGNADEAREQMREHVERFSRMEAELMEEQP
jgi:DNA-binding FadR family transcriptional regulator